jgi:hypothetical protein
MNTDSMNNKLLVASKDSMHITYCKLMHWKQLTDPVG